MPLIGQLPPGLLSGAANTVQANQGFGGAAGGGMVGGGILQLLAQLQAQGQQGGAPLPAAVEPNPELSGVNPGFVPDPGLPAPPGLLAPGTVPGDIAPGPPPGFPGFGGDGALPFLPGFGQPGAQGGSFGGFGGLGGLPGGFQRFDTGGTEPTIASGGPQFRRPGGPQGPGQIPAV